MRRHVFGVCLFTAFYVPIYCFILWLTYDDSNLPLGVIQRVFGFPLIWFWSYMLDVPGVLYAMPIYAILNGMLWGFFVTWIVGVFRRWRARHQNAH
jgi:hypothetical protein